MTPSHKSKKASPLDRAFGHKFMSSYKKKNQERADSREMQKHIDSIPANLRRKAK